MTGKNLTDWREAFEGDDEEDSSELFSGYLSDFLFAPEGGVSTNNFRWAGDGELVCGEPAPNISVQLNDLKKVMIRCMLTSGIPDWTKYGVVQLKYTPEIKVSCMVFERYLSIFTMTSLKQHK